MSKTSASKICSTLHKYLDKKTTDNILPLLKNLDDLKDLRDKDAKNVYEVCSRVMRKVSENEEEIISIAKSIKLKYPKPEKSKTEKNGEKPKEASSSKKVKYSLKDKEIKNIITVCYIQCSLITHFYILV